MRSKRPTQWRAALSRRRMLGLLALSAAASGCDVFGAGPDDQSGGLPRGPDAQAPPYTPPTPTLVPPPVALPAVVTDVAGAGEAGDSGDGGSALVALFRSIAGVDADASGSIFLSDSEASKVRRIRPDGIIETLAGTGLPGFGGDGGPALSAQLTAPTRITVDGVGSLFIAEPHRVRRVGADGVIGTILGDGQPGFEGDGGPAAFGRTAGNAGMAIDGDGNLFVAERAAHRVRRIATDGTLTTVAGTGIAGGAGDGGPAASAQLDQPGDVEVDRAGNLLIAELAGNRIRRVSPDGLITALAGTGAPGGRGDGGLALAAELHGPQAVASDSAGNVFVADWNNRRIRRITPDGRIETIAGLPGGHVESGGLATATRLRLPVDIAVAHDGRLLLVEQLSRRLRALAPLPAAEPGPSRPGAYLAPASPLPLGPPVANSPIAEIYAGSGEPGYGGDGGDRRDALFAAPRGIALDGQGRIIVADTGNHRIRRIELDGTVSTIGGTGAGGFSGDGGLAVEANLNRPLDVVVDSTGVVFVADAGNFRVRRIDLRGIITTAVGGPQPGSGGDGGPAHQAQLTEPTGLELDSGGALLIADAPAHRVRRVDSDGTVSTLAGSGEFGRDGDGGPAVAARVGFPQRVAITADGYALISQLQNGVIRRVSPDGQIVTVAGSENPSAAEEGAATETNIEAPIGLAADGDGNAYIVESGAGTITRLDPAGTATLIAGDLTGQGQPGGPAREVPFFTAVDIALGADGSGYLLESRGLIWHIRAPTGAPAQPTKSVEETVTSVPTIAIAQSESAVVQSVSLSLRLDSRQGPVDPTLEFHPSERVNVAVLFADVVEGSRLGIRWYAGDREQGAFLTDPQPAYTRAPFGFYFYLPDSAPVGQWRVEVLVGAEAVVSADFVVSPGEPRNLP